MSANETEESLPIERPVGNAAGFAKYFKYDILSGFLVFLIALPLCLGISLACGYPAIAGIFTAIVGAIVTTFISNSELTIKGPAAGLIVIAIGCIEGFGGDGAIGGFSEADLTAYRMALAVGVAAAILQIIFGLLKAGTLGEFFPLSAVHGMLAAIGVIIIVKQLPVALGVQARGEPLEMIKDIPQYFHDMNPEIAFVGGIGVLIMFLWPIVQKASALFKPVPAALVVILATVPLGIYFDMMHTHTYSFHGHKYEIGESFLVNMPDRVFGMFDYITTPDFAAFDSEHRGEAFKWVMMFFIIGSLESILSAKAVDIIDPWKRKTNMDRDILAVGVANLCASSIGGLPMISEIVRSKANIDNGARTRFADMWHGIFLLACVALIPTVLHRIPLAALAAMLIYTGFRLTHPREFMHIYSIGKEQLLIFVSTLVGVLATDLLIGIFIGIGVKLLLHLINGVPIRSLLKPYLDVELESDDHAVVRARYSAVFSNWILFRRQLVRLGLDEKKNVTLDLSETKYVDHTVMEKLHELQQEFKNAGVRLELQGLDNHRPLSSHDLAARKKVIMPV
ncbi:SulP family inorganic anion transporter [Bythopirellula polymerisocia]|uniref:C4-dicarboxylic acid transporter DauA n=1 Tax=Bythopirellula polymerisocia TaxID=2528003 RepID=A0A5C6CC10_9BACT|nr:SulP family inorganic anion transporter [Bythopirellula polymerisocia]TWU20369.1 C4-dicarboxylic acid transporter DauA [Bythopirellula polymerisocia]